MASKTSSTDDWPGRRIDHRTFASDLAARRAELDEPELPRNAGKNRTTSKKVLLKAVNAAAVEKGVRW